MGNYLVGYRKPPKATQFKKGRSGNPRGRPKGALNLATDLAAELGEQVTIREHGRSVTVSKQRAIIKSLVANALKGDPRATAATLALHARTVPELREPPTVVLTIHGPRPPADIPKMIGKPNEPSSGTGFPKLIEKPKEPSSGTD